MKTFIGSLLLSFSLFVQAETTNITTEGASPTKEASAIALETPSPAPIDTPSTAITEEPQAPIVDQLQALKKTSIELNRDLFILEEDLLFPASTQVTVFLSMDVGTFFKLDSVELIIDDETVTSYLYTQRQIEALQKGGLQRLYMGNLKTGTHEISAFFIGKGPKGKDYKRAATLVFEKGTDPMPMELKITDSTTKYQPQFSIVKWDVTE